MIPTFDCAHCGTAGEAEIIGEGEKLVCLVCGGMNIMSIDEDYLTVGEGEDSEAVVKQSFTTGKDEDDLWKSRQRRS